MRRPALRALAALAVPLLFALTATSLRTDSVSSRPSPSGPAALASRTQVLGLYARASRGDRRSEAPDEAPASQPRKVRPAAGGITGVFGEWRGRRAHPGLDIDGTTHDPIVAALGGTVSVAGWAPQGYGGYGIMVLIDHGMGIRTLYAHLAGVAVQPGQRVEAGQLIGSMGNTGASSGSHLHLEVILGDGSRMDPAAWLAQP